jgi:GrpB-like predicted nucleotidyltransferase (UPF0157 family)/GNAT superfamily N-acetyltransferase
VKVRPATHADLDGIFRVHVDAVRQLCKLHYTPEEIEAWVGRLRPGAHRTDVENVIFLVAVDDAQAVLGFTVLDVGQSEVKAVYVHPTAARRGIGAALLREAEAAARRHGLTVLHLDASLNSVEFYFGARYIEGERRRHLLRSGIAIRCVPMIKSLVSGAVVVPVQPEMPVFLVPYDESWPAEFETERAAIGAAVGERILAVEHFGSTAIAGMMAKPIIDIMVLVADITVAPSLFDPLELLGYHYFPHDEEVTPERRWFCKPSRVHRTHHLHVVEANSPRQRDSLAFRDFLRGHPSDADRYLSLKRELAARFPDDREAYTGGKAEFIRGILEKARARDLTT